MTTVHVILSGIISLIPHPAHDTVPAGWTVRLQDAPLHVPSLVIEKGALVTTTHAPDDSRDYQDKEMTSLIGWWLGYDHLKVGSTVTSDAIDYETRLLNVLAIVDGCDTAKCALAKAAYAEQGVTFEISQGTLETTVLEGGKWKFHKWDSQSNSIAEEICWSFEIDEDHLDLSMEDSDGTPLTLAIKAPTGGTIELRLQNLMAFDMFPVKGQKPDTDPHVALYFDESVDPPASVPALGHTMLSGSTSKVIGHTHRLADVVIGAKKPVAKKANPPVTEKSVPTLDMLGLRVNCPPAQWAGTGS